MLDGLFQFLPFDVPALIRFLLEFLIGIILIRGILASDITTWLEDKGFIRKGKGSVIYRSLDFIYDSIMKISKFIPNYERRVAVWLHYRDRHSAPSALGCEQGECDVLLEG